MYRIISDGITKYSDTIVFIKVHENGCYVSCDEKEAEGICVKTPIEISSEDGSVIATCEDVVYALQEGGLSGVEPICTYDMAKVALEYFKAEQAQELLAMIEEVL